ncbi:MAG: hypothetical protein OJF49_003652 [Ktedonobacterales bacterium]|jgi:hypothetical protein|nr:MAG: hypothetical protein OJF49_003652 [Ktedonobacterales bacterium]
MSASTYDEILSRAQQLDPADQLRLLSDLANMVRSHITSPAQHSILELEGLGKDIWKDVDVQAYIDVERDSWG